MLACVANSMIGGRRNNWGAMGMSFLIWPGAALSLVGLIGLIWCIILAGKARKAQLDSTEMTARLQKLVALNMGALGLSTIGLMMVVIGILLG